MGITKPWVGRSWKTVVDLSVPSDDPVLDFDAVGGTIRVIETSRRLVVTNGLGQTAWNMAAGINNLFVDDPIEDGVLPWDASIHPVLVRYPTEQRRNVSLADLEQAYTEFRKPQINS